MVMRDKREIKEDGPDSGCFLSSNYPLVYLAESMEAPLNITGTSDALNTEAVLI